MRVLINYGPVHAAHPLQTSPIKGEVLHRIWGAISASTTGPTSPLMGEASVACRESDLAQLGGGGATCSDLPILATQQA